MEGAAMSQFVESSRGFFEELHRRASAGVEVSLLWSRSAGKLIVSVADTMTGESFELPVAREEALEAFNHPFAYAAGRGISWGASGWGLETRR
jgi:hypothetical protein